MKRTKNVDLSRKNEVGKKVDLVKKKIIKPNTIVLFETQVTNTMLLKLVEKQS